MYIPPGLTESETRYYLRKQVNMGQHMILGTVLLTALQIWLMLCNVDLYVNYSLASAYYLVWLGRGFDNDFASGLWTQGGVYTTTAVFLALVILGAMALVWHLSRRRLIFMKLAMVLILIDGILLIPFTLGMLGDVPRCLWDVVIHGAVLLEMRNALQAQRALVIRRQRRAEEAQV